MDATFDLIEDRIAREFCEDGENGLGPGAWDAIDKQGCIAKGYLRCARHALAHVWAGLVQVGRVHGLDPVVGEKRVLGLRFDQAQELLDPVMASRRRLEAEAERAAGS